jgi:hypothetical protein
MTLWNHLDDGPSHNGHLLRPFESLRGDTLGTNPRQTMAGALGSAAGKIDIGHHLAARHRWRPLLGRAVGGSSSSHH